MRYTPAGAHDSAESNDEHEDLFRFGHSIRQRSNWYPSGSIDKHLGSEFIGSFLWQFLSLGSAYNAVDQTLMGAAWAAHHGTSQTLLASLGKGLSYVVLLYNASSDKCSGGRLNPVISTGLFVARKTGMITFSLELVAQFSGSFLGALLLTLCLPPEFKVYAPDEPVKHMEQISSFSDLLVISFWHFASTSFLVFVYFSTCVDFHNQIYTRNFWPLAVGCCMVAASLAGGPDTGGAMDPAGSVALAILRWDLRNLWAYLAATFLGAIITGVLYSRLLPGGVTGPPLNCGSVFEGIRQQTEEFQTQNFMMYFVVDSVTEHHLNSNEWSLTGRICYPDLGDAVAHVHGTVTQDGKVLKYVETWGPFADSTFEGHMPDSSHVMGVQSHANQTPLSNICLLITPVRPTACGFGLRVEC